MGLILIYLMEEYPAWIVVFLSVAMWLALIGLFVIAADLL